MALAQSSEPAPSAAKCPLDSASPAFIAARGAAAEGRLDEAAREALAVSSAAVVSSGSNGLLCSYLQRSP